MAHARRGFINAIKVQTKAQAPDAKLERAIALMDGLFAIDREAREQNLSLADRHALRQERAPALLGELHALLSAMQTSNTILPQSIAGKAISYTLKRWVELTCFLDHPIVELSTNWEENSMRPIAIGRKNWLHLGSKEAGPKIAAIFSIVESCRKLGAPIRQYLADALPGLADRSIHELVGKTPTAYAATAAKQPTHAQPVNLGFARTATDELHALLSAMQASGTILPQSVAGKAISYTLKPGWS